MSLDLVQSFDHLATPTFSCNHVFVLRQNEVRVVIKIQQGDGRQLRGHATRWRYKARVEAMQAGLHLGVAGDVDVTSEGKGALPAAVKCIVATRGKDPILKRQQQVEHHQNFTSHTHRFTKVCRASHSLSQVRTQSWSHNFSLFNRRF